MSRPTKLPHAVQHFLLKVSFILLNFPLKVILKDVGNNVTGIHFGYPLSGLDRALIYYCRVSTIYNSSLIFSKFAKFLFSICGCNFFGCLLVLSILVADFLFKLETSKIFLRNLR